MHTAVGVAALLDIPDRILELLKPHWRANIILLLVDDAEGELLTNALIQGIHVPVMNGNANSVSAGTHVEFGERE